MNRAADGDAMNRAKDRDSPNRAGEGIRAEHVRKAYDGREVLRYISFHVPKGGVLCLTAPSGTGKTTLLRILTGLASPDRGKIFLPDPCRWSAVFQENRLLEHLNAAGNLRFALGKAYNAARAAVLLDMLGLSDAANKRVREYSGGMKRRLALARALLFPADAFALDEPFAGLDAGTHARCLDAVRTYTAGKIVILATHDTADAEFLSADILILPSGTG